MDARDIIDELSLQTDDIDSLLGIMENIIIELDEKTSERMQKLIDNLEDLDDVMDVYHNWDE